MRKSKLHLHTLLILILTFLIACSSVADDNSPIVIKDINVSEVSSSIAPKDAPTQTNIELKAVMDNLSSKQDLRYEWRVEYLDLDLDFNAKYLNDTQEDATSDSEYNTNSSYFFVNTNEADQTSLIIFVYKDGYYKVTLDVTNLVEKKTKTAIIKVGEPELPKLNLSFNIPYSKKIDKSDFVGRFILSYVEKSKKEVVDLKVNASDLNNRWFPTDVVVDPFKSFELSIGSFIVRDETNPLKPTTSIESKDINNVYYSISSSPNDIKKDKLLSREITFDLDSKKSSLFQIFKDENYVWEDGELFFSILTWGYDKEGRDLFEVFNGSITEKSPLYKVNLSNKYFVKVFFGSFGHKSTTSDYYVYFGPDGLKTDEFDPSRQRSLIGVPYGYILGKLGDNGKVFPIGYNYSYLYLESIPVHYVKREHVVDSNESKNSDNSIDNDNSIDVEKESDSTGDIS